MGGSVVIADGILTLAEAARELGISRQAVSQLVSRGVLAGVRLHGRTYVSARSVADRRELKRHQLEEVERAFGELLDRG